MLQTTVTVATAYLAFFVGEHVCAVSGVLSTCGAALVLAYFAWPLVNERETLQHMWHMFEYIGNTLIFLLAGLIVGETMTTRAAARYISAYDYGALLAVWLAAIAIRAAMLGLLWPLLLQFERANPMGNLITWRDGVVMAWGGLRGAVGLALAIVVDNQVQGAGGRKDAVVVAQW